MRIMIASSEHIAQQSAATGMIAVSSTGIRFRVVLVDRTHQITVEIVLQSANQIMPIVGKESFHLIRLPSIVFIAEQRSIVQIRCGQIHDHGAMIEGPKRTARIIAIDQIDTVAWIQIGTRG